MKLFKDLLKKMPLLQQTRKQQCCTISKPKHLICFKNWTTSMIWEVLESALNLKCCLRNTHGKRLLLFAVSLALRRSIEALNRSLRDIRGNTKLMGGVTVLLTRDFRQTLVVVPKGARADEVKSCIKLSNLWPQVNCLKLSKNMRAHLDGDESAGRFSDLLLKFSNGDFPSFDGMITIPEEFCTVVTTNILADYKVMILQEVNEPFLNMAVSKAATLLGAYDVNIIDHLAWEQDYMGRVFSFMADAIFVATMTHMCVQRFADQSTVPVVCMRSRTHASIQSLATMMAIIEEFGTLKGLNLSYFGSPHPVLNSYLLLCPMLGINMKFMCCCQKTPVSPLLYKASEDLMEQSHTQLLACSNRDQVLQDARVVIAGPANPKKVEEFKLSVEDIENQTNNQWIFFHTGPRGEEVEDKLFFSKNSKTFVAFENFHYIAAALMANVLKDHKF